MRITMEEVFKAGFLEGFKSTMEGYNADYPFNNDEAKIVNATDYKIAIDVAYIEFEEKIAKRIYDSQTNL